MNDFDDGKSTDTARPSDTQPHQNAGVSTQTSAKLDESPKNDALATVNPTDPSIKSDDSATNILPARAYNQWPPFGDSQHPAYLAAMAKGQKHREGGSDQNTTLSPYGSTSKTKPIPVRTNKPSPSSDSAPKSKPKEVAFGEPSIIKPTPSSLLFAKIPSSPAFATCCQLRANPFTPTPRLEAYILRPTVQTTDLTSMLSYRDELLQLSDETMQMQIRNLGFDYSIMNELLNLHPNQLHLMQGRASQRHGNIVSIKHGRPSTLDTVLGSLQVQPVIYVISTTTILPQGDIKSSFSTVATKKPADTDNTPGFGGGLFGPKDPLIPNFGTSNFASSASAGSHSHLASLEAYSKFLQDKDEICTYVEGTESKGRHQHYQTITTNKDWHGIDRSLEEIRLADYKAGRTEPMIVTCNSSLYSWEKSAAPPGSKPFTTERNPTSRHPSAPCCPPGDNRPSVHGALFEANPVSFENANASGHLESSLRSSGPLQAPHTIASIAELATRLRTESAAFYPRFGSPVGAVDPSDQSKWDAHSQGFCAIKHQHGVFCRVSPAERMDKSRMVPSSPEPQQLASTGYGKFAGKSSKSTFAALTSRTSASDDPFVAAPSQGQYNMFKEAVDVRPSASFMVNTPPKSTTTIDPQPVDHTPNTPCTLFGCQTCRPDPFPVRTPFIWGSAGSKPEPPSWAADQRSPF